MKKVLTLFAVAAMAFAAQAAELTVAQGTDQADFAPIYGMYMDTRGTVSQVIYPADMLADMQGGTISAVKFYPTEALKNFGSAKLQVALMEVEQDRYTVTEMVEGATVVVPEYTVETGATELVIEFETPFVYNGGNLMIETTVTEAGSMNSTKFNGVSCSYAVGLAQYTYSWSDTYYYETEQVLPKATFTYEGGGEEPGIATLAEANALEDDAQFTFDGDAVVTVFKNNYLFLRDESGYAMIPGVTGEFENGQVLSQGWSATKTTNEYGWVRYTDAAGLSASGETNAELAAAQVLTSAPDETMINAYVVFNNVTFSMLQRKITLEDGTTSVSVYDMFGLNFPGGFGPDNRHWNFYGIIGKMGDQVVLYPTEFVQYVEPPTPTYLRGDVNHDNNVSIGDVTALIDMLLEGATFDNPGSDYDCNLDQNVSIGDVTALIDFLLSGSWED